MISFMNTIKQNRKFRNAQAELYRLSDRELADLGIFRADIPAVVRGHRRPN